VWQAPLGVRSSKRRHQSPEWTILSHSYRLIQGEIVWSQVLLDSLHPCSSRMSLWSPTVLRRGSSYDTPGICLVWHSCNVAERRKRRAWTIADRRGCPVVCLTSSFRSWWYHLIPNNVRKLLACTKSCANNEWSLDLWELNPSCYLAHRRHWRPITSSSLRQIKDSNQTSVHTVDDPELFATSK